jgi:2-polyprenyl-3-methyl-5-hydroxy-6-metoxy-1,4-benzoquinol methylase
MSTEKSPPSSPAESAGKISAPPIDVADKDSERIDMESENYDAPVKARHRARYAWAVKKLKERFNIAGRVIDYACGTGYGSAMLAEVSREVYGRDRDAEAVRIANARHSSTLVNFKQRDRIEKHACVCDSAAIGFKACSCAASIEFDAVVSIETIEHLDPKDAWNAAAFLAECRKLVIPNGLLILSTPLKDALGPGIVRSKFHPVEYSVDEINKLVEAAGFVDIKHDDVMPGFIFLMARKPA